MNFKSLQNTTKKLRVWWCSNGYTTYYYIDEIENAQLIIDILAIREVEDKNIDFNVNGVEIFENNEWCDWYSEEGLAYDEYMEDLESREE